MIGDVLLESTLDEAPGRTIAGFENHAGRTVLDDGRRDARPRGRRVRERRRVRASKAAGPDGRSGPTCTDRFFRGTRGSPTCSSPGRSHTRRGREPEPLAPLADVLEREAHAVSRRPRPRRGGRLAR